jgi:hypothetical protein
MRLIGVILCASLIGGCAAHQHRCATTPAPVNESIAVDDGAATTASALVFDPPVAAGLPVLELARDDRQPSAFVAYDDVQTTYFYLRLDDRQRLANDGRSERRVISETFGISRR